MICKKAREIVRKRKVEIRKHEKKRLDIQEEFQTFMRYEVCPKCGSTKVKLKNLPSGAIPQLQGKCLQCKLVIEGYRYYHDGEPIYQLVKYNGEKLLNGV